MRTTTQAAPDRRRRITPKAFTTLLGVACTVLVVAGFNSFAFAGATETYAKYEKACIDKGWKKVTMKVGGLERQILWKAPSGKAWNRGAIVALHGGGGTYSNYCANMRIGQPMVSFSEMALKDGYAVFLPDSTTVLAKDDAGNACGKRWDSLDRPGAENQDVDFIRTLIAKTIPDLRPSSGSHDVFLVGISNGGFMSILAATRMPNLITAFTPVSSGDPYSTSLVCNKESSSMMRQTPGIFVDRGTGKSIADKDACDGAVNPDITLARGSRPPFMFLYHQSDGGVDTSCKVKAMAQLTAFGFPETAPFIIKSASRKNVFKHLWQDAYNTPLLKFLESRPEGISSAIPSVDGFTSEAEPGTCALPEPTGTNAH